MVWGHLAGGHHSGRLRPRERLDRLARREVQQVQRLALVRGQRQVSLDHQALGHRRVAGKAELGGDRALVHLPLARESRLLAVDGEPATRHRVVLQRPPHQHRRDHGPAVVGEARGALVRELGHLRKLAPFLPARDRGEEPDRDLRLRLRVLD